MLLNCGVGEDSWESLGLQGDPTSPFWRRLDFFGRNDAKAEAPVLWPPHAKSWLWKRLWCWEGLGAGGEGDDRGWDGWMAFNGHELEQALGDGEGQESVGCCSAWACRVRHNWTTTIATLLLTFCKWNITFSQPSLLNMKRCLCSSFLKEFRRQAENTHQCLPFFFFFKLNEQLFENVLHIPCIYFAFVNYKLSMLVS